MLNIFWKWYQKKYKVIVSLTTLLFLLQIVHLYWLTTNIVFLRLFNFSFWSEGNFLNIIIALVDYTEIPAIITSSILYIYHYRIDKNTRWYSLFFLFLINSQWFHLFWITDEIIYAQFTGVAFISLPVYLSYLAISIDYLELPVIFDSLKKTFKSLRNSN